MKQTVTGSNISVNVARAVSRLKTRFCSFNGDYNPTQAMIKTSPYDLVKKEFNYFYHPMGLQDVENPNTYYDFKQEL